MDIITNFGAADVLDFTGIGTGLNFAGKVTTSIAAHSIGFKPGALNTYVYVNTSGAAEPLASANMEIRLIGNITLASGNIAHL